MYKARLDLFDEELIKKRAALGLSYLPSTFQCLVNVRNGWRRKSNDNADLDWIRLAYSNNAPDFTQALFPQSGTSVRYVTVTPTILASFITRASARFDPDATAAFIAHMRSIDRNIAESLVKVVRKRKVVKQELGKWTPHPRFFIELAFPKLKRPSRYSLQFSSTSNGQTCNFLVHDHHRRNAHSAKSAAVLKHGLPQRDFRQGTLGRVIEDEYDSPYSTIGDIPKIPFDDLRIVGDIPDEPHKIRESFRKGVGEGGNLGVNDNRLVNTPILEREFCADGNIEVLGPDGLAEFLKDHNVISFDPGASESGSSAYSLQYTVEGSLSSRAITNKFRHFGSHDLKMDTSRDGSGFEDQRTNDAAAYSAYSARFERIYEPTITQKYANLVEKRGIDARRKATQRARSKVAKLIMQMNTALNVRV